MLATEILEKLAVAEKEFSNYCLSLNDDPFFFQPIDKWSAAQQVKHLIISANKTRTVYILPKFMVRWITGKPNRPSRTYDELVAKYKLKLQQGGKASKQFVPAAIGVNYGKQQLMAEYTRSIEKLSSAMKHKWSDSQLDKYLAPHPLLGKITLRELGYFTIHHTYHHLESIRNNAKF